METRSRMSRSLHTNRDFEKLEPYEGKPSRTVLRGEEGSNALDLPDRPADMEQRNGRAVRKGNTVKLWGGNVVDIVIYGTEKTLDAHKFNLLKTSRCLSIKLTTAQLPCAVSTREAWMRTAV